MPWEVDNSTGLLGHFIGTINSSIWTTDSQKSDPNAPFLQWHVSVDDILQESFQGTPPESVIVNVTIGKGWVEDEDGLTVEHKDGVEVFKASSAYGKIIGIVSGKSDGYGSNAKVLDGDGDLGKVDLSGVAKYMQANGYDDPRVASIWEGLTFEFRGIGFVYRGQDGDPYQQSLPVRLVGEGSNEGPKASTKAAPAKSETNTTSVWSGAGADDETAATLNGMVNTSKNHAAFMKNALVLDAVKDNDTLRDAVMDAANFPG